MGKRAGLREMIQSHPFIHFLIRVTGGAEIQLGMFTCLFPLSSFYNLIFYVLTHPFTVWQRDLMVLITAPIKVNYKVVLQHPQCTTAALMKLRLISFSLVHFAA